MSESAILPRCPYCDVDMQERSIPAFEGLYRCFSCGVCHCELKQPLVVRPEKNPKPHPPVGAQQGHLDCPECAFGDVHCSECDDTLCDKHVRTVEKYAGYFSDDLAAQLKRTHGGRLYCPLCFQSAIKKFSGNGGSTPMTQPKIFNFPVILGLLSLFVIITIGIKNCDAARSLDNPVEVHDTRSQPER